MDDFIQVAILLSGIAGQLCMYKRSYKGFYFYLVSNALLMAVSYEQGLYGMLALYIFFSVMSLVSIWNWRRMDREAQAIPQTQNLQPSGQ